VSEEEIEDVVSKPESMLGARVKQVLIETIDKQTDKALKEGQNAYAMELQRAKKLVQKGCWSLRKANPFLEHMSECLKGQGGNLEATQKTMQACSLKWNKLPPKKKREYEERAKGQAIYDFL